MDKSTDWRPPCGGAFLRLQTTDTNPATGAPLPRPWHRLTCSCGWASAWQIERERAADAGARHWQTPGREEA